MAAANITPLIDEIKAEETVADGAAVWINGGSQRLTDAVNAALALGATADELKPLVDEIALQKSKMALVAAALVANTPSAP